MPYRHDYSFATGWNVRTDGDELCVESSNGVRARFRRVLCPALTLQLAEQIVRGRGAEPLLVEYERGNEDARAALQGAGISYLGADGRVWISAPEIYIERDALRRSVPRVDTDVEAGARNPFSRRSGRVPRWLLLHHHQGWSVGELAEAVGLNHSAVSRIVRSLEDAAFIQEVGVEGRRRRIALERPRALLNAWLPEWQRRRVVQQRWDIGGRDVDSTLRALVEAREEGAGNWVLGGVAGAALIRRVVEPGEALVWTSDEGVAELRDVLDPHVSGGGRTGRGRLRVAIAPDPWTLKLADHDLPLPVADPVQLWLDASSEGERALEAAEAIAEVMDWS